MKRRPAAGGREEEQVGDLRRAWVAARLNGVRTVDIPDWTQRHDLPSASGSSFERAVAPLRAISPSQRKRGRGGGGAPRHQRDGIREWLLVDESVLGVRKVLYRLPNDGLPQPNLLNAIASLNGTRQVLEAGSDRELIVVALVRTEEEANDLRSRLEELAPGRSVKMDPVSDETWSAAPGTWIAVARSRVLDG